MSPSIWSVTFDKGSDVWAFGFYRVYKAYKGSHKGI